MEFAVALETDRPAIAQGMGPALAVAKISLHSGLFGAVIGGLGYCLDVHGMPPFKSVGHRTKTVCPTARFSLADPIFRYNWCGSGAGLGLQREALLDPSLQLVPHLAIRSEPHLTGSLDNAGIEGRPIFDIAGHGPGQFGGPMMGLW